MSITDPAILKAMFGHMREATLQGLVMTALREAGWVAYHTHDSRRSDPGFPDVVAIRRGRIIYRELKKIGGRLSPEQIVWRDALLDAGADYAIWNPYDWGSGSIIKEIE